MCVSFPYFSVPLLQSIKKISFFGLLSFSLHYLYQYIRCHIRQAPFVYYACQKFQQFNFFILCVYFFHFTLKLLLAHIFLQWSSKTHCIEPHLSCFRSSLLYFWNSLPYRIVVIS